MLNKTFVVDKLKNLCPYTDLAKNTMQIVKAALPWDITNKFS